jgi:hypothetical protein
LKSGLRYNEKVITPGAQTVSLERCQAGEDVAWRHGLTGRFFAASINAAVANRQRLAALPAGDGTQTCLNARPSTTGQTVPFGV